MKKCLNCDIVLVYYNTVRRERRWNLEFRIDPKSGVPFYRQIIEQVKFAMARGDLEPGTQLPTVRQLAVDLSINPNTVIRAYRQMEIEGLLETHQGSGTFVGDRKPDIDAIERQRMLDQIITEMLARASSYGLSFEDVLTGLQQRKERSL
ncbi:MAG: GntR family transcriptional regulator [Acidobacteria bacterium]|nr:MAG: GntR family transcriptional regulator [Acidobacteriota bacterium]